MLAEPSPSRQRLVGVPRQTFPQEAPEAPMAPRLLGRPARIAALAAALIVIGGVACSVVRLGPQPSFFQSSGPVPTTAPAAPATGFASRAAQPAAVPAPAQAGGAALAPAIAANESASKAAMPADAAAALPDTSAQILDRMVIRTAQLTVEVADIGKALGVARDIAARGDGFVSNSNTRTERVNDQDRMLADLTIQVRSIAVDSVISELRGLGNVTSETSGSQDVTEEYVDLGSNLRNLQATESAILKLMDKATQIQDVLSLQRELTNIRGQIERIQGRRRFLEHRTDMATITLALRPLGSSAPQPVAGWDPLAVAQRGWQASLNLLRGVVDVVIIAIAFSWWLVPFVALGAYLFVQRRRPAPPAAQPAPPAAP